MTSSNRTSECGDTRGDGCTVPSSISNNVPCRFDPLLSLRQLKYAGLFEAIHIRKAGYAIRMPLDQFFQRYKHCCQCTMKMKSRDGIDLAAVCRLMLDELAPKIGLENSQGGMAVWAIGKTRFVAELLLIFFLYYSCYSI